MSECDDDGFVRPTLPGRTGPQLMDVATRIRALPLAPDTHDGERQKHIRENAARIVEGRPTVAWEDLGNPAMFVQPRGKAPPEQELEALVTVVNDHTARIVALERTDLYPVVQALQLVVHEYGDRIRGIEKACAERLHALEKAAGLER